MKQYKDTPYYVSEDGKVFRDGKELKQKITNAGYKQFTMYHNGLKKYLTIHRIVAELYIANPENKSQVNHINGIKTDNRVDNLEWNTHKENIEHSLKNNLQKRGSDLYNAKLKEKDVEYIRKYYKPRDKTFSGVALSKKFKVSPQLISHIIKYKAWTLNY